MSKGLLVGLVSVIVCAGQAWAQGLPIKDGNSATLAEVNANGAVEVVDGRSSRPTYIASASALTTTALYGLAVESGSSQGFKLVQWCVGVTSATAAAGVTVTVRRTTAASSGGTVATAEGTGTVAVSKFDPADGNYPGVARGGAISTTNGATLDQLSFMVGEIGAGTADAHGIIPICKMYGGATGEKPITVVSGTANGIAITVSSLGAGGLAFGSVSATVIVE